MIDDLYDLIGGRQTVWAATEAFYKKPSRMTHSVIFLRVPIWRSYTLGKACLSPCFSADESCIPAKTSMPLMSVRGSKG